MTNLLTKAIATDDVDQAAKIIQDALGIADGGLAGVYLEPDRWPEMDSMDRAGALSLWLRAEIGHALPAEALL